MNQLNSTYKRELFSEDLLDVMKQIMEKASPKMMTFVVMTGKRGMKMFSLGLFCSYLKVLVKELCRVDKIIREEEITLNRMINFFSDNKNLTVSKNII